MPFMETWRRRCIFRGNEELCLRHLSFKVPKGQTTGGDTEHTVGKKGVKLQREVMAEDKDLQVICL